jgi:hypothetical protein
MVHKSLLNALWWLMYARMQGTISLVNSKIHCSKFRNDRLEYIDTKNILVFLFTKATTINT